MEFKGTKGKWFFDQDKEYPTLHNIWSDTEDKFLSQGTLIARTCYAPLSQANAQLIAHAPEMLEMLLSVKDLLEAYPSEAEMHLKATKIRYLIKSATEV